MSRIRVKKTRGQFLLVHDQADELQKTEGPLRDFFINSMSAFSQTKFVKTVVKMSSDQDVQTADIISANNDTLEGMLEGYRVRNEQCKQTWLKSGNGFLVMMKYTEALRGIDNIFSDLDRGWAEMNRDLYAKIFVDFEDQDGDEDWDPNLAIRPVQGDIHYRESDASFVDGVTTVSKISTSKLGFVNRIIALKPDFDRTPTVTNDAIEKASQNVLGRSYGFKSSDHLDSGKNAESLANFEDINTFLNSDEPEVVIAAPNLTDLVQTLLGVSNQDKKSFTDANGRLLNYNAILEQNPDLKLSKLNWLDSNEKRLDYLTNLGSGSRTAAEIREMLLLMELKFKNAKGDK